MLPHHPIAALLFTGRLLAPRAWFRGGRPALPLRLKRPVAAVAPAARPHPAWVRAQQGVGGAVILAFVLLTWVRAESLARLMPHLLDLALGVTAALIGNSLAHWFRLLGVSPLLACTASHALKLVQIVGVPVAYLLLGGHLLLLPVAGAVVAATMVVVSRRLGWTSCAVPAPEPEAR